MARQYSNTATPKTLTVSATAGATTITVSDTTGLPGSFPYTLVLDAANASMEVVTVTAAAGTVLTVTRGEDGTTGVSHSLGASVEHYHTKRDFSEPQTHIDATAAHGATGAVVGTTNTQTLTNKTISADNNTLSGIAASSFVLSNGSGNIDGSAAQKVIPAGAVVGTSDTQTLTNKTLTAPVLDGAITGTSFTAGSWTPTFSNVTLGNGSVTGAYVALGKLIIARWTLNFGSTTNVTGQFGVDLPVTARSQDATDVMAIGQASAVDASDGAKNYGGVVVMQSTTSSRIIRAEALGGRWNATIPFTWATSDTVSGMLMYEAA